MAINCRAPAAALGAERRPRTQRIRWNARMSLDKATVARVATLARIKVHTKLVPDLTRLADVDRAYVRGIVETSIRRLRAERLAANRDDDHQSGKDQRRLHHFPELGIVEHPLVIFQTDPGGRRVGRQFDLLKTAKDTLDNGINDQGNFIENNWQRQGIGQQTKSPRAG